MAPTVFLFLVCVVFVDCQSDISFNSSLYRATIQAGSSNIFVFAVGLSRNLTQNEMIEIATILGDNQFQIDPVSLVVEFSGTVEAGPHTFDVFVGLILSGMSATLVGPAVVDVVPQFGEACSLQPFGVCSQNCVEDSSTTYGYRCTCSEGYILQNDGQTCLANDPFPELFLTNGSGVYGFSPFTRTLSPPLVTSNISTFDYHFGQKALYYADNSRGVIARTVIGTTTEEVHLQYTGVVKDLAVDWIEDTVVFTYNNTGILLLNSSGGASTLFSSRDNPRHLAVAAQNTFRFLFWSEGDPMSSAIVRSSLSSNEATSTIASGINYLVDLALEFATETLYWITASGGVYASTFDGSNQRNVLTLNSFTPAGFDVFADAVYVTFPSNHSIAKHTNFNGGDSSQSLLYLDDAFALFTSLVVYHPLKQPSVVPEITSCDMCSDVCVLNTSSIECQCSTGYRLSSDGQSCFPDQVSDLVLSSSVDVPQEMRGLVIKATIGGEQVSRLVDTSFGPSQAPVTGLIYAMDFDLLNGLLFYGDRNSSTIWKVSLHRLTASQDDRVLLTSDSVAWDMAFDWIADVLYWTNDNAGAIYHMTSPANSFSSAEMFLTGLIEPRGVSVDPFERWLYWIEAGSSPRIRRIGMDSSDIEVLVSTLLLQPTGITIDFLRGRLYWGDLGSRTIESCELDGSDRRLLYFSPLISPFQVDIVGNSIVWTSEGQPQFNYVDIFSSNQAISLTVLNRADDELPLYGVVVISESKRLSREEHTCITKACSHHCFLDAGSNPMCSCPSADGYTLLPDGLTCQYQNMCPSCYNGGTCVAVGSTLTCSCPVGFTGSGCLTVIPSAECDMQSCQNGGTCSTNNGSIVCQCTTGYSGTDCSVATNTCTPERCLNGGTCEMGDGLVSEPVCLCPPGFMGNQCENMCTDGMFGLGCANECSCLNGATCDRVDGICTCSEGYTGEICDTAICNDPCQNEGICVEPDVCVCQETYAGANCNIRVCTSDYCENGGTCFVDFLELSCRCPVITSGDRCQLLDVIPDFLAVQVGVPVGVILPIIFVAVLIGFGIFYYVKCVHKRTKLFHRDVTCDNAESGNKQVVLENPIYGETSTTGEKNHSPYHVYDTVDVISKDAASNNFSVHTE